MHYELLQRNKKIIEGKNPSPLEFNAPKVEGNTSNKRQ